MPRRNPPRALRSEDSLARRIAHERETRGWTYEGLAKRMTDAGCAINASGLYKVEKGEPRRRITVDELVALSRVFELELDDLMQPPEVASSRRLHELLGAMQRAADETLRADADYKQALADLADFVGDNPEWIEALEKLGVFMAEIVETLSEVAEVEDQRLASRLERIKELKRLREAKQGGES